MRLSLAPHLPKIVAETPELSRWFAEFGVIWIARYDGDRLIGAIEVPRIHWSHVKPKAKPGLITIVSLDIPLRGGGGGGGRNSGAEAAEAAPRVVMQFPSRADDILLSGELAGGDALTGRALALDQPLGKGHVVMFALRPFWRWQSQGTYTLGFNAIEHLIHGC